jgi:phage protein D
MALTRSEERSGLPTDYYAPDFRLVIENQELPEATKGDVLEVKVVMDLDNMTSAELTINNWDDEKYAFKYSDFKTFDIGNRVHVQLGYADRLVSMMRGQIASVSPRFPESGPPTMQVTVLDGMLRLRDAKPVEADEKRHLDVFDWEIAQRVAERNGLILEVVKKGPRHELVVQMNESDARFLKDRARRIDFDVYITTEVTKNPVSGEETLEETLHFMPPTDGRDDRPIRVYKLVWGESLIDFTPSINLSRQVVSVTVQGWSQRTKEQITATATADNLPPGPPGALSGPQAAARVNRRTKKPELMVETPVYSEDEARELALSTLLERAYEFSTGSGRVIGLPDLRPGDNIELAGLGERFSDTYYVQRVEHTLGGSGFTTQFEGRRLYVPEGKQREAT